MEGDCAGEVVDRIMAKLIRGRLALFSVYCPVPGPSDTSGEASLHICV